EVLEDALAGYDGAFVIATHDRYLLDQVTNKVVEVSAGTVTVHAIGYRDFVEQRGRGRVAGAKGDGALGMKSTGDEEKVRSSGKRVHPTPHPLMPVPPHRSRSELLATEQQIEALEQRSAALAQTLGDPDLYRRSDDYQLVLLEHEEVASELNSLTQRWEQLAREVEVSSR
ncbi:MAG TPA: hypothetical protein VGP33_08330, partial [Chloroflexota bacterium]|nr:hypothetical protein [Chloroflexota bacterium]